MRWGRATQVAAALVVASLAIAGAALAATGDLTFEQCIEDEDSNSEGASCTDAPGLGGAIDVAASGGSLYAASFIDDAIAHFSLDPTTGAPGFQACIEDEDSNSEGASCADAPGLGGANGVAASGSSLYAASLGDDAIVHFSLNPTTGAPGFQGCIEDEDIDNELLSCTNAPGLNDVRAAAVGGGSLYAASESDDAITHFSLNPTTGAPSFQG